jgi:hypothetical protein
MTSAPAVDLSGWITTADTNVELIIPTTVETKKELRPAPTEAAETRENAPNEPNPAGSAPAQNDWAKFEAWNRGEADGEKPENGITRDESTVTETQDEPVQAELAYPEHQIAEPMLVG